MVKREISVVEGSGQTGRKYGPCLASSFTEPSAAPTKAMVKFLTAVGDLYDCFKVHTEVGCTLPESLKNVDDFFSKASQNVEASYKLTTVVQGPQGCVSRMFQDNIKTLLGCLQSLMEDYPVIVPEIKHEVISTMIVENFFSFMRDRVVTPDTLEFAVSFSSVCTELIKKKNAFLPYLYFMNPDSYYERPEGLVPFKAVVKMPKIKEIKITQTDRKLLDNYRKKYLQSVKQLSIRQQNIKFKAGPLPLYAYQKETQSVESIDFEKLLIDEKETGEQASLIMFPTGTLLLLSVEVWNLINNKKRKKDMRFNHMQNHYRNTCWIGRSTRGYV
ncbi:unnamed protein product [Mytilus coruscus]|uniref:Uncharacterized protein n=1 Tax=Mytilus coruscus TaxID=42192 RepID=A0A6J8BGV8_MYTCO|nr:unnamed protein product [Mytilus coruscus]